MKILMLLDTEFPPDIRVENEAQSLLDKGHEVHILCYNFGNAAVTQVYKSIRIHRFKIKKQLAIKMLGLLNQIPVYKTIWIRELIKILKSDSFDAIHLHDLPLCCLIEPIKKRFNGMVTADMHENYPYLVAEQPYMNTWFGKMFLSKEIWFKKEKEWLQFADNIVCVADEMKTRLISVLGNTKPITVTPNTLNFNTFVASQKPVPELKTRFSNRFVISFIGGIDAVRGIEYMLEAVHLLENKIPELLALIVGDGQSLDLLKQKTQELGIEAKVVFEGFKPSSNMAAYIELSDICIIPHVRSVQTDNSSPNKLFQYMYFGKPVISSNCTSLEKLILTENCGLIFNDRDSNDLAEKVFTLYKNSELRMQLGFNGSEAVKNKYNWAATASEFLKIYQQ